MTLRGKLLSVFLGLAAITLLLAGLTLWTTARWSRSEARLDSHYVRSLLVQQVRVAANAAVKEALDATLGDPDARAEYDRALAPAAQDLEEWARLADTPSERAEVERVREAYQRLLRDTDRAFSLVESGDREAAVLLIENEVEARTQAGFTEAVEAAVQADADNRGVIRASIAEVRRTARTALLIAAVATVSLVLLLAAYLATDLFRPLRQVEQGLDDLARGNFRARMEEERRDEIGGIHRAFNHLAAVLERQARLGPPGKEPIGGDGDAMLDDQGEAPSRVTLHTLLAQLRVRAERLRGADEGGSESRAAALLEIEGLAAAASRTAEFSFPFDLELEPADLGDLLYSVLVRHREELARRGIGIEARADPSLERVVIDRLKLREALSEAVRNALAALPDRGGRIGLRAVRAPEEGWVLVEVADNGNGADQVLVERALAAGSFADAKVVDVSRGSTPKVGLALARDVAERHGGRLEVLSEPGRGTVVRFVLPLRE